MTKLLWIQASPRGDASVSTRVAQTFLDACREAHPALEVDILPLFDIDLPAFDASAAAGKYAMLSGSDAPPESQTAWERIRVCIDTFRSADLYLVSTPMWNFSIPYRLKQYIDVIVQPGYTFRHTGEGYEGLVTGRKAVFVFSSGGDFSAIPAYDMQKPYVRQVFGFMGITETEEIVVAPTMGDPETVSAAQERALAGATECGRRIGGALGA